MAAIAEVKIGATAQKLRDTAARQGRCVHPLSGFNHRFIRFYQMLMP